MTSLFFGVHTGPVPLVLKQSFDPRTPDRQTAKIVLAARAFLASLDAGQYETVSFPFSDHTQRANWSNFPEGMIPRRGLKLGTLSQGQQALLDTLLAQILSEKGLQNLTDQLAAEQTFPFNPILKYGTDHFMVALLGTPSESMPWMIQFGGHHLALNVTVYGPDLSFSPMLTGGQPLRIPERPGLMIASEEAQAVSDFLASLTPAQLSQAMISEQIIDLRHGPGTFGIPPDPQGIAGQALTARQKDLLVRVIDSRLAFFNEQAYQAKRNQVLRHIDQTFFGVWGQTTHPFYFRIVGPTLILEYAPQLESPDDMTVHHLHSIYRDPTNDYGVAWIAK